VLRTTEQITDQIGLQSGDVIVQVNNTRVTDAESASRAIDAAAPRGAVVLVFERGRQLLQTRFYLR
jgi:type II secretory pathway component PulC